MNWWKLMDVAGWLVGVAMAIAIFLLPIVGAVFGASRWWEHQCESRWQPAGFETKFSVSTGCLVRMEGDKVWIPASAYRKDIE
jgi:hypothetical protein